MYYDKQETDTFSGFLCLLTLYTFDKRKPWRRRLHLYDETKPGNDSVFVGIQIFPPPKLTHCLATFERKPWSTNKKPYYLLTGETRGTFGSPSNRRLT